MEWRGTTTQLTGTKVLTSFHIPDVHLGFSEIYVGGVRSGYVFRIKGLLLGEFYYTQLATWLSFLSVGRTVVRAPRTYPCMIPRSM